MTEIITDQINSFVENELFSFYELGSYYRRIRRKKDSNAYEIFERNVVDIEMTQDAVYNRIMILETSSKSIFLRKFIDYLADYNDEHLKATVGLEILKRKGVKPKFDKPLDSFGYSILNDEHKLNYFDLENLDFDFYEELEILSKPYIERLKKFKDFLLDYSKTFTSELTIDNRTNTITSNKVFIVHGHNDGIKFEVAQTLNKIGITPIILHEQISENKTIIEKIESNSDVKYAIVLLTDDDSGKGNKENDVKPRARQNVVFEMGYFIGLLGRQNVCCIVNNPKLEKPNDISGIVYINYNGNWVLDVAKELKNVGFEIDMNKLF